MCYLIYQINSTDSETGISLFVLDSFLVTLSSLFLEDDFHSALCVFYDGGCDLDVVGGDDGIAAEGVFTRADLVDL